MGLLSDFFVATPRDAVRYAASMAGESDEEVALDGVVGCKGVLPLAVEILWAQLAGSAWNADAHALTGIARSEDGEIRLDELPAPFVALLAGLDESAVGATAAAWSAADDVEADAAALAGLLAKLRRLAFDAREHGKGLYLWTSL